MFTANAVFNPKAASYALLTEFCADLLYPLPCEFYP